MLAPELCHVSMISNSQGLSLTKLSSEVVRRSKLHLVDLAGSERAGHRKTHL